jgi:hypothetical protein
MLLVLGKRHSHTVQGTFALVSLGAQHCSTMGSSITRSYNSENKTDAGLAPTRSG